jgi:transcriptional regulator with XRE-family HTH domain
MDVRDVRRFNLNRIAATFNTQREFAEAAGISPAYAYQLLTGYRPIGEKIALRLEKRLKLDLGLLSQDFEIFIKSTLAEPKLLKHNPPDNINESTKDDSMNPESIKNLFAATKDTSIHTLIFLLTNLDKLPARFVYTTIIDTLMLKLAMLDEQESTDNPKENVK